MAIIKSAKKRIRSSEKKRIFNLRKTREMKETIKKFLKLIETKKIDEAEKMIPAVYKAIDKVVGKGIIKKNTGARKKSRLVKKITSSKK